MTFRELEEATRREQERQRISYRVIKEGTDWWRTQPHIIPEDTERRGSATNTEPHSLDEE